MFENAVVTGSAKRCTRYGVVATLVALLLAFSLPTTGCSRGGEDGGPASGSVDTVTIGTLATEDMLPYWVAGQEGLFEQAGIDADIVVFQSATELIAGISSGSVDLAMTDPMVTASLFASGTDVRMMWVTLGLAPEQGRFGIMVGPNSSITSIDQLAGVPVGVGSNTVLEYVMDELMADAGIPSDQIVVEELQKLPVRYQALMSGEVEAAALPGSLLALGEASGCRLVADDTTGGNLSQSVMIGTGDFADPSANIDLVDRLTGVWDDAVDMINADPEKYRSVLVENANLPEEIAGGYPVSEYPHAELPTSDMVDPVLEWMSDKGYLTVSLSYDGTTGRFSME